MCDTQKKSSSKVVLITGGSRGIGAATALLCAQQGYDVAINFAGNVKAAEAVALEIKRLGQNALLVQGDVANEDNIMSIFSAIDREFGRLDGLVNNAGVVDYASRIENMTAARMKRIFDVNILGAFLCAREAIKRMAISRGGQGGSIINLSSAASRLGAANSQVDYAASKGAIDVMTKGLAQEVGGDGIRVNAVRPGLIETEIHATSGDPARITELLHTVPLGRYGSAEEVAEVIVWLMSDKSSYVHDSIIDVTGGR